MNMESEFNAILDDIHRDREKLHKEILALREQIKELEAESEDDKPLTKVKYIAFGAALALGSVLGSYVVGGYLF